MTPTPESLRFACRRISVCDLLLQCAIGAYDHERGRCQTVIFDCDAWVERTPISEDRLDEVLNYDFLVETMRGIALDGHTDLQETLLERMGNALLTDSRIRLLRLRSRKTEAYEDVGSVGLEIWCAPHDESNP